MRKREMKPKVNKTQKLEYPETATINIAGGGGGKSERPAIDEARDIIYNDREKTYGRPEKNLSFIADFWKVWIFGKTGIVIDITAEDVCAMMVMLKLARQANSYKRDNIVDGIGYLGLIERIKTAEGE